MVENLNAPDLTELRDELRALSARVTALESHTTESDSGPALEAHTPQTHAENDSFWALNGLTRRRPEDETTQSGAVMLVGNMDLPTGGTVSWQQTAGSESLLENDWAEQAHALAALGHPARLNLLRHILNGARTTSELTDALGDGTSGQLHHHLRQLIATGWVRQAGRGLYEVPANRIVPLLACVMGGER